MEIIDKDFASIRHNTLAGERVWLSVAAESVDGEVLFFIVTDSGEDTGPREKTAELAKANAEAMWGSDAWDLQYT